MGKTARAVKQSWQWRIEISGFDVGLFTKGKAPTTEFDEVTFASAGSVSDEKSAGRMKFEDLTFEKGILASGADNSAYEWLTNQANSLGNNVNYMRDIQIFQTDRNGNSLGAWNLFGAWIKKYEGPELEGGKSDAQIEKITICYQSWEKA